MVLALKGKLVVHGNQWHNRHLNYLPLAMWNQMRMKDQTLRDPKTIQ